MEIFIERDDKTINVDVKQPVALKVILKQLSIPVESVILIKNDSICLEDELVKDTDKIKLLSVVSGG